MIKLNFNDAQFDYEPYPVCYIPNFIDTESFKELADTYPEIEKFTFEKGHGNKYSLSEIQDHKAHSRFLNENKKWRELYDAVKTKEFVEQVVEMLNKANIDLGLKKFIYTPNTKNKKRSMYLRIKDKKLLSSKMDFAIMPASGGNILPHTDHRLKLVTIVLSFIKPGEWNNKDWGGGTDVLTPKDRSKVYNMLNKQGKFEDMEVVKTFPFNPNQCVLFIKTYNSWHSVSPMTGPESALRKTVTINIENII